MSDGAHYRVATRHDLTPRQREVLDLIARGHTNPEIAERLGISLEGAKHHVSEILSKLDVPSREAAAEWWRATRPSPVARLVRAMWPWPAVGAGVAGSLGVVALLTMTLSGDSDDPEVVTTTPSPSALTRCRDGELTYTMDENQADGSVYFRITATSPQAPCRARGDVNLVPVPARVDEPVQVAIMMQRNFPPQVDTTIGVAGTEIVVLKWSNWCQGSRVIVWRPMSTLAFDGARPFIDDAAPTCTDRTAPSMLERIATPPPVSHSVRFAFDACGEGDISFALYEEAGWRPGESALLEVQPSGSGCSVYIDSALEATLYVDGARVGSAAIHVDAPLQHAGYRVPFRWSGPCVAGEVRLEITFGLAEATLYPTARPHCEGAPATHSIRAGW